jgi:hypothetical protein
VYQALGKPRRRLYGRRQSGSGQPMRRPEVDAAISRRLEASPASKGYRRLDALLTRQGLGCDPNTVRRVMRRHGGFHYLVLFLEEERFVSIVELLPRSTILAGGHGGKTHSPARGVSRNTTSDLACENKQGTRCERTGRLRLSTVGNAGALNIRDCLARNVEASLTV